MFHIGNYDVFQTNYLAQFWLSFDLFFKLNKLLLSILVKCQPLLLKIKSSEIEKIRAFGSGFWHYSIKWYIYRSMCSNSIAILIWEKYEFNSTAKCVHGYLNIWNMSLGVLNTIAYFYYNAVVLTTVERFHETKRRKHFHGNIWNQKIPWSSSGVSFLLTYIQVLYILFVYLYYRKYLFFDRDIYMYKHYFSNHLT